MSSILAQVELTNSDAPWQNVGRFWHDYLLVFVVLAVVSLLALVWAVFFRKRPRHDFHRFARQFHEHSGSGHGTGRGSANPPPHRHRHRHRRRREHRPRNPTLAETGGLPPLRTERGPERLP